MMRYRWNKAVEWLQWKIAYLIPKKIAYLVTIRVGAHATTGEYGATIVPELTFIDAIKRWSSDHFGWT